MQDIERLALLTAFSPFPNHQKLIMLARSSCAHYQAFWFSLTLGSKD